MGGHGLSTNRKVGFRAQQLGRTRSFLPPETGVGEARFQFCFSTEVCGAAVLWFLCGLASQGRLGRKQPVRRTAAPFAEADVGSGRVPSSPSSTVRSTFIFPQQLPWRVWGAQTFISERPSSARGCHTCPFTVAVGQRVPGGVQGVTWVPNILFLVPVV